MLTQTSITEATSISGSLEAMSLALATKRFVSEKSVVLAGACDRDPGEMERVRARLHYVPSGIRQGNLPLSHLVYVHVDIDVLDPSISPGVNFQGAGGMTIEVPRDSLCPDTSQRGWPWQLRTTIRIVMSKTERGISSSI